MSHSNQSKDYKALNHLKSFGAIILLLMDGDKPLFSLIPNICGKKLRISVWLRSYQWGNGD